MAIQFNLNALSRFSNVNFGDNDAIANLDGSDGLVQNEKLGFILTRKFRGSTAEKQNNAVRKSVIDAISKEDGDVSEILFSLDSKIVELPVNAKAAQVEDEPYEDKIIEIKNEPENEIIEVKASS